MEETTQLKINIPATILLVLFLLGFWFRLELNGVHELQPGNVKAADPVYHVVESMYIAETGKAGMDPPEFSHGNPNIISNVPPLLHVMAGALSFTRGLKAWNIIYGLTALLSALCIVFSYLIVKHLFHSETTALLAAGLQVIPFETGRWWYYLYIGIWPQFAVFVLFLATSFFVLKYSRTEQTQWAFLLAICTAAQILMHYSLLPFLLPLYIAIGLQIVKKIRNTNYDVKYIIDVLIITIIPLTTILIGYVRLLALRDAPQFRLTTIFSSQPYIPNFLEFGTIYNIIFVIGCCALIIQGKRKWVLTAYVTYCLVILFLGPYFITNAYYISMRQRLFLPTLFAILIGYAIQITIFIPKKMTIKKEYALVLIVVILAIGFAYPGYATMQKQLSNQQPAERYEGQMWVATHTQPSAIVYYLAPNGQREEGFTRRTSYAVDFDSVSKILNTWNRTDALPTAFGGEVRTGWSGLTRQLGIFRWDQLKARNYSQNLLEYDYLYLENIQGLVPFNQALSSYLIQQYNYTIAFNNGYVVVLQHGQ